MAKDEEMMPLWSQGPDAPASTESEEASALASAAPLAERMRPVDLEEFVDRHLPPSSRRLIRGIARGHRLPSLILYGPPGCGKTTLARLLSRGHRACFESLSATEVGVKAIRSVVEQAQHRQRREARPTVLFVDEIHRFNRGQQDALLPHVESGRLTLIGATTEHPGLQVNAALLSRVRVLELKAVGEREVVEILKRALQDKERGLGEVEIEVDESDLLKLAQALGGDLRRALNALELAAVLLEGEERRITWARFEDAMGEFALRYDRAGQEHYNLASAWIKSMRASDCDAAVYWMARMIEGGEDPRFIARRLVIFAAEDVGNADPQALVVAQAALEASASIGLPEAVLPLSQACLYLAMAKKSNTALRAYFAARKEIRKRGTLEVPLEIRNAVSAQMKKEGYGQGYRYPHDLGGMDPDHRSFLPEELRDHLRGDPSRTRYVFPSDEGWEGRAFGAWRRARRGAEVVDAVELEDGERRKGD